MKKFISLTALLVCFVLIFFLIGCTDNENNGSSGSTSFSASKSDPSGEKQSESSKSEEKKSEENPDDTNPDDDKGWGGIEWN